MLAFASGVALFPGFPSLAALIFIRVSKVFGLSRIVVLILALVSADLGTPVL